MNIWKNFLHTLARLSDSNLMYLAAMVALSGVLIGSTVAVFGGPVA